MHTNRFFILIFFMIIGTSNAFAQHTIGGGCTIENQLCEEDDNLHLQRLEIQNYMQSVQSWTKDIPRLYEELTQNLQSKDWYLDDRPFNPALCGPQSLSETPNGFEISACQDALQIRISKTFWETADETLRAKLVLHEVVVTYFLWKKLELTSAREATFLILHNSACLDVRNKLVLLGLPRFSTVTELEMYLRFVTQNKSAICRLDAGTLHEALQNYVEAYAFQIVEFREDFQTLMVTAINDLFKAIDKNPVACDYLDDLASASFINL